MHGALEHAEEKTGSSGFSLSHISGKQSSNAVCFVCAQAKLETKIYPRAEYLKPDSR